MKFTVVWTPTAAQLLASIWLAAPDRQSVTDAADRLDSELRRNPTNESTLASDGSRSMTIHPLTIRIDLFDDDCRVVVFCDLAVQRDTIAEASIEVLISFRPFARRPFFFTIATRTNSLNNLSEERFNGYGTYAGPAETRLRAAAVDG